MEPEPAEVEPEPAVGEVMEPEPAEVEPEPAVVIQEPAAEVIAPEPAAETPTQHDLELTPISQMLYDGGMSNLSNLSKCNLGDLPEGSEGQDHENDNHGVNRNLHLEEEPTDFDPTEPVKKKSKTDSS